MKDSFEGVHKPWVVRGTSIGADLQFVGFCRSFEPILKILALTQIGIPADNIYG